MNELGPVVRADDTVAIFGGPYSNLEATQAFFEEMARLGIPSERVICTGDVVAYCADAAATTALVRASGCRVVMGNVEENLAAGAADCGCGFEEGSTCDRLSMAWFAHATAQVSADDRAWMGRLPRRIQLEIGGYRFAVVHGGVDAINQTIYASTDAAIKTTEIGKTGLDGVIGGHCGLPFTQCVGAGLWHNSGALGMPANDGTPRVWFSVFRRANDGLAIEHRALHYDHATAAAKMRRAGLPEGYAAALGSGILASADTLPTAEHSAGGVPLRESQVLFRRTSPEGSPLQRAWPVPAA
ncbi:MAG TPA: metallophosphoesterase family protein [Xanthobacteraceae bacterium]|nr:metallophosphoesterase family protein [Xanthobacteraceae bacterium]